MSDVFDIYTIIFLALAVFIFLAAQRAGPADRPRAAALRSLFRRAMRCARATLDQRQCGCAAGPSASRPNRPSRRSRRLEGRRRGGLRVAAGINAIAQDDKSFDAKHFVTGARAAYEMIVTAYAEGDRRTLKNLLSRDVYEGFEAAIKEREGKGETAESRFVSIEKSDITAADLRAHTAQVTVRFVSQLVSVTRDRDGNVIDGSPEKVTDVTDVWTFARDVSSRDPNWKLVATEAGQ